MTDDSVEVTFSVPADLADDYDHLAGQYVALRTSLDGTEVRRSYSLCRAPEHRTAEQIAAGVPTRLSVAVKRDEGGLFSTWAQTGLHPGFEIDVMSPQGTFTSGLDDLDQRHVVGIAAGSGITPLMALAHTVLTRSDTSRFTLLYTNRSTLDVMFLEDLADLKDRYPTRLTLHHVLSREQRTAPVLSGRIDEEKLRTILDSLILPSTVDETPSRFTSMRIVFSPARTSTGRAARAGSSPVVKSSKRMCSRGTPTSASTSRHRSTSESGPHRNHSSTSVGSMSAPRMVRSFSSSMRPDSTGAVRCSRESTWCSVRRVG